MADRPRARRGTVRLNRRPGPAVAAALAGAWRASPPPMNLTAEALAAVVPCLLETGAGGLGWWRVRGSALRHANAGYSLHLAYRQQVLEEAQHEDRLRAVARLFATARIHTLFVKGWSVARLYPAPGLRPCGDIDLCVPRDQLDSAVALLAAAPALCPLVDLHAEVADVGARAWGDLCRRSRVIALADVAVRVLGPEDQLRQLCLHFLRHGGWRPLWLCDIAAALEATPANFDWDYLFAGQRTASQWVACAIELARRLLGARPPDPAPRLPMLLPAWLAPAVLRIWDQGAAGNDTIDEALAASLTGWTRLRHALHRRWPNPIRAAIKLGVSPTTPLPPELLKWAALGLRALDYGVRVLGPKQRMSAAAQAVTIHPARVA